MKNFPACLYYIVSRIRAEWYKSTNSFSETRGEFRVVTSGPLRVAILGGIPLATRNELDLDYAKRVTTRKP